MQEVKQETDYSWPWFHQETKRVAEIAEREPAALTLLAFLPEFGAVLEEILARPSSPLSDRPQDYVAALLASRSFRLTIGAIQLSLSGYPDSAVNLQRTVWEVHIRCLDLTRDSVAGALGFLLDGVAAEIKEMQTLFARLEKKKQPTQVLAIHLKHGEDRWQALAERARAFGFDPKVIQKQRGHLNVFEVCKDFEIEDAYRLDYAHGSGHVHEKNRASPLFVTQNENERVFELGPVVGLHTLASIADTLTNLSRVLWTIGKIVDDEGVLERAGRVMLRLRAVVDEVRQNVSAPQPSGLDPAAEETDS
jgi:hypothetical protein